MLWQTTWMESTLHVVVILRIINGVPEVGVLEVHGFMIFVKFFILFDTLTSSLYHDSVVLRLTLLLSHFLSPAWVVFPVQGCVVIFSL